MEKPVLTTERLPFVVTRISCELPGTTGNTPRFPSANPPNSPPRAIAVGTICPCVADTSTTRLIAPVAGSIWSTSPWFGSTAYRSPLNGTMLYQVPSGSKSSSSGFATGCVLRNALRFAIGVVVPFEFTRRIALSASACPWEQPAPASSAYSVLPMKATSATPLWKFRGGAL